MDQCSSLISQPKYLHGVLSGEKILNQLMAGFLFQSLIMEALVDLRIYFPTVGASASHYPGTGQYLHQQPCFCSLGGLPGVPAPAQGSLLPAPALERRAARMWREREGAPHRCWGGGKTPPCRKMLPFISCTEESKTPPSSPGQLC